VAGIATPLREATCFFPCLTFYSLLCIVSNAKFNISNCVLFLTQCLYMLRKITILNNRYFPSGVALTEWGFPN